MAVAKLDPTYIRHEDGEIAIAIDVTSAWRIAPAALASAEAHWDPPSLEVAIVPPPPKAIDIVTEPNVSTAQERVGCHRRQLAGRRISIVGGLKDPAVRAEIETYFGLEAASLRWIESTPGKQPQTERLKGMRGHGDLLCCLIGCKGVTGLGHAGSEVAVEIARNRGIPYCKVERPSQILDALVALLERK